MANKLQNNSIELVIEFWDNFYNSEIRKLYNYIKHKGKPLYKELSEITTIGGCEYISNGKIISTNIRDVKKIVSLSEYYDILINFDNNKLFPYI